MAEQWREPLARLSFLAIGTSTSCSNHYTGRIYTRSDHLFGVLNLFFLPGVTVLPYPIRAWCLHVGSKHEPTANIALTPGLEACRRCSGWASGSTRCPIIG